MTGESQPELSPPPKVKAHNARGYLNHHELGLLLRLHAEETPQTVIAQRLGITQSGVCKALKRLGVDSTELARHHLKARSYGAARAVTAVLKTGKTDERLKAAKLVLQGSGVITEQNMVGVAVQVVIGSAATPALEASAIDVLEGSDLSVGPKI